MDICTNIAKVKKFESSVLTIGSFDGMHCGHLKIIKDLKSIAHRKKLPSVVITFDPHPKSVLQPDDKNWNLLTSTEKKLEILRKQGVDYVWVIPFDLDFSRISAEDFLKNYLMEYFNPVDIIIGYDHHFGFKRLGDAKFLRLNQDKWNYTLHVMEPITVNDEPVCSTRIRHYLRKKEIETANKCLGWDYEFIGVVTKGEGIGITLNFPTANLIPENQDQLIPGSGVYCVEVEINRQIYQGMCNIGSRPTFYSNGDKVLEVHLITDDKLNLYDKHLKVTFKQFLREEKRYSSADALANQLQLDRHACLSYN